MRVLKIRRPYNRAKEMEETRRLIAEGVAFYHNFGYLLPEFAQPERKACVTRRMFVDAVRRINESEALEDKEYWGKAARQLFQELRRKPERLYAFDVGKNYLVVENSASRYHALVPWTRSYNAPAGSGDKRMPHDPLDSTPCVARKHAYVN